MKQERKKERLLNVFLNEAHEKNWTPEVRSEYDTAVRDLLSDNYFHLCKNIAGDQIVGPVTERGPYDLYLKVRDGRLLWDIRRMEEQAGKYVEKQQEEVTIPMTPFRSLVKDYFLICESYYSMLRANSGPSQIETVDMARRGIHNEGAELLVQLVRPALDVDFQTARRLFTLISVLHIR